MNFQCYFPVTFKNFITLKIYFQPIIKHLRNKQPIHFKTQNTARILQCKNIFKPMKKVRENCYLLFLMLRGLEHIYSLHYVIKKWGSCDIVFDVNLFLENNLGSWVWASWLTSNWSFVLIGKGWNIFSIEEYAKHMKIIILKLWLIWFYSHLRPLSAGHSKYK